MRAVIAVVMGYGLWTILWLGGNAGLRAAFPEAFPEGGPYLDTLPLVLAIALSVVCSLASGALAAAFAKQGAAVFALALLLLATGVFVQTTAWDLMPLWYHLVFLALVVPTTLLGGRLRR